MVLAETGMAVLPGNWRPLRLGTMVGLRWLAITGQAIGVLFVAYLWWRARPRTAALVPRVPELRASLVGPPLLLGE